MNKDTKNMIFNVTMDIGISLKLCKKN